MEGKGLRTLFRMVFLGVLILCLLVEQTQVEANICCRNAAAKRCYKACMHISTNEPPIIDPKPFCLYSCRCEDVSGGACPRPGYHLSSPASASINEYCKLGCASSVCNIAISTLQDSGKQIVKEVTKRCNNACSEFCTKGSTGALETA